MNEKNESVKRNFLRQGLVLFSLVLAILIMMGTAQLLASPEPGSADTPAQSPVASPTLTLEEAIAAYVEAHIIHGDISPAATVVPVTTVIPETADSPLVEDYDVSLLMNMSQAGFPGETVMYVLTLSNTGVLSDVYGITAVSTWDYTISPTNTFSLAGGAVVTLTVAVDIPGSATNGDSDVATVTATSQTDPLISASVQLTTTVAFQKIYLPIIAKPFPPPPTPALSATRPNSANHWQMEWSVSSNQFITGYELQMSQDPTFVAGVTTLTPGSTAISQLINTVQPSPHNVYYFRIRAIGANGTSPWSNTVQVVGGYYDTFNNNQSGWSGPSLKDALRRLTFIEKIDSWYENNDWLIMRVEDSWDWGIASPLQPAPQPPYAIEFRSMPANLGNLVSHGVVFGADWGGEACPDWSSVLGVYAHENCFNHFYNTNLIWSSNTDLTLLWERVDQLVWCPQCDGSPLKRLGHVPPAVPFTLNASGWNDYRIEVREGEIKFFLNGALRYTYNDTRWIDQPYFGVFVSTDEYSNSTWRYEYFRITPLDN
jgi:hypothetical protein